MVALPRVSVVVPTVDRLEMVRRAVKSVMSQDYAGEIECLVVIDGPAHVDLKASNTPTRTLRVLRNERTPGLAGNRNTGYLAATGTLVANCDDDDEWLPAKLTAQVELLRQRPDASIVTTGIVIRHDGRDTVRLAPKAEMNLADFIEDRHTEVHPSGFLMDRRTLLERVGLVDENLPGGYAEDYELLLRAARIGPVVSEQRPLTRIHWHGGSFFTSRWVMIDEALSELLARTPEFRTIPKGMARIEGQLAFANAAIGRRRTATRYAVSSLRKSMRTRQSYAALLVASGIVSADRVVELARRRGRGI